MRVVDLRGFIGSSILVGEGGEHPLFVVRDVGRRVVWLTRLTIRSIPAESRYRPFAWKDYFVSASSREE